MVTDSHQRASLRWFPRLNRHIMQEPDTGVRYTRAPLGTALVTLLFDRERHLDLAVSHGMAINLEAKDLAEKFRAGTFPQPGWEEAARQSALEGRRDLLRALRHSLFWLAGITALALTVLWGAGNLSPDLPIAWHKVLGGTGVPDRVVGTL